MTPAEGPSGRHVVFGTGAIGLALVDELSRAGMSVRAVNRSGRAQVPDGVDVVGGDASDPAFAAGAAAGATAVYQCLNPPYHRWVEEFSALQDAIVAAARSNNARYVSFENTYMYGDTHGAPMTEQTPCEAHTRKGKVRLAMAEQLQSLHDSGELVVATARASDYFGPRGTSQSPLGDLVIGAALKGKKARVIGDPDQPHSYTYTVDAARTLSALGSRDDVDGEVFHVPNAPARSTRELINLISRQLDAPIKLSSTPRLLLRALGVFNPTLRELDEMLYEFTQPFVIDSTKAQTVLGLEPTPIHEAISATIAWFRNQQPAH
jgi:nucleoside-diphosphate-sugar epimerase